MSTHYSSLAFNIAMLILRVTMGALMMSHGYSKLTGFASRKADFYNFLGIGSTASLSLAVFAEFFCALFIIIGLFTRAFVIPLIIIMSVALFKVHNMDFFDTGEAAALFLSGFTILLLCGPGKASVDGIASK